MLTHIFTLTVALMCPAAQAGAPAQAPTDPPQQMSLAERAALARKATAEKAGRQQTTSPDGPPPLTPEQRGAVRDNAYVNDFLHFRIDLAQWEPLSDERISVDQAMARKYVNPDFRPSPYRVLWIGDGNGRTALMSIMPLPPDAPRNLDDLIAGMKKVAEAELVRAQDLREYDESILLGDPAHKFAAFRLSATVKDTALVQSEQLAVSNGFLFLLAITGRSDQDVSEALRSLKTGMAWTTATR